MEDNDHDQDNTESAISEELSRFSSPTQSQSSSCTSISNPFYDGPMTRSTDNESTADTSLTEPGLTKTKTTSFPPQTRKKSDSRNPYSYPPRKKRAGSTSQQYSSGMTRMPELASSRPENVQSKVMIIWDIGYLFTCYGVLQVLQIVMSIATLVCLVNAGEKEGGLLNLPLSWHFRIMLFILVLSLLLTSCLVFGNVTSLIGVFGLEWTFFDFMAYSLFAFLYLVGSSLVASAFDFYEKMGTGVSKETIDQLVISVVLGYACMVLNGLTGFISFRKWKFQYRLYQRRKLIEEDEIDL